MISGNSTWNAAVAAEQKRPLYALEIPGVPKYISSFLPSLITSPPSGMLPYLQIPSGAGQSVSETDGHSSLSDLSCTAIDYGGELLAMAADQSLLGQPALLKLGFPGMAYSDFVTIFYGTLLQVGRDADGLITFEISDPQKSLVDTLWLNGGPTIPAIAPVDGAASYGNSAASSVVMPALDLETVTGFPLAAVVSVVLQGTSESVSGITDTAGNTYVQKAAVNATGIRSEIWVAYPAIQNASNVVTVALTGSTIADVFVVNYENVLGIGGTATNVGASVFPQVGVAISPGDLQVATIGFLSTYTPTPDTIAVISGNKREGGAAAIQVIDGGLFDSYSGDILAETQSAGAGVSRTWACAAVALLGQPGAVPGDEANPEPQYDNAFTDNGQEISDTNKRYVYGHPLDILLVAMQNELGLGQNPSLPPPLVDNTQGAGGTDLAVYGADPSWQKYVPGDDTSLINPNPLIDVDGILALRDGLYRNERMEFVLTRAVTGGKSWLDDQILKPLGLYWIAGADGTLRLKPMKQPQSVSPLTVTADMIVGIPVVDRLPIINFITMRSQVDNSTRESAARQYGFDQTYVQQTSINRYKQQYASDIESDGLRSGIGAAARGFLTVNATFNRHAFGTAEYSFTSLFRTMILELGDFILLTHPALADLWVGSGSVAGVLCEVSDRQPNYSNGTMDYKVLDTRWFNLSPGVFDIAATSVPVWASASSAQQAKYVFMTDDSGKQSDGTTAGNPIF